LLKLYSSPFPPLFSFLSSSHLLAARATLMIALPY
jgi:hypothetical protein